MSRVALFMGIAVLMLSTLAAAQEEGFGLGVILGEPTGINFKAWTGYSTALVGAAAWSFEHEDTLHVHLDYVIHNRTLIKLEKGTLPVYYGIGARIKTEQDVRMGIRFPLGVDYMFRDAPLDIFVEIVPVFELTPRTDLYFNGGIGVRYFF